MTKSKKTEIETLFANRHLFEKLMIQAGYPQGHGKTLKENVEILKQVERGEEPPTQEQINFLYKKIYNYTEKALIDAKKEGKPLLLGIGEMHTTIFSKGALLVEQLFLCAAKHLGVKVLFTEGNISDLKKLQENLSVFDKEFVYPLTKKILLNAEPIAMYLVHRALIEGFNVIPAEKLSVNEGVKKALAFRDSIISDTVLQCKESALLTMGLMHLQGVYEDPKIQKKFFVKLVSSMEKKLLLSLFRQNPTYPEEPRCVFFSHPAIDYFYQTGMLEVDPNDLPEMVAIAHENLFPSEVHNLYYPDMPKAGLKDLPKIVETEQQRFLSGNSKQIIDGDQIHFQTNYPFKNQPFALFTQMIFYGLSKRNMCENPNAKMYQTSVVFNDEISQKLFYENQRKRSAEKLLSRRGTSLNTELNYCFGKTYTSASSNKQKQQEQFLINIINGEFSSQDRSKFLELLSIEDLSKRSMKMNKLMESAKPKVFQDMDFSFSQS